MKKLILLYGLLASLFLVACDVQPVDKTESLDPAKYGP